MSNNNYYGIKLLSEGLLRGDVTFQEDGVKWKGNTGKLVITSKDDITGAEWLPQGNTAQLRLQLSNGKLSKLCAFRNTDKNSIGDLLKNLYNVELGGVEFSTKGVNFGSIDLEQGNSFTMKSSDTNTTMVEFPLTDIAMCALPNTQEIELQFHEDDTVERTHETLVEMRLRIPDGLDITAEDLHKRIRRLAKIDTNTSFIIADFDEITFTIPRGRYSIEMYSTFFRMHGSSYDYKIVYKHIQNFVILPKPDMNSVEFVISLNTPIRQGKQQYHHLVIHIPTSKVEMVNMKLSEEEITEKYGAGRLNPSMSGSMYFLLPKIFRTIARRRVLVPGNFKSFDSSCCIQTAFKNSRGYLYPFENRMYFITKPPLHIMYDKIDYIEFQRYTGTFTGASHSFDIVVQLSGASGDAKSYTFTAIERKEYPALSRFFKSHKLRLRGLVETNKRKRYDEGSDGDSIAAASISGDDDESPGI
jgi:structure-specific recognition protein 1